jgi:hypothetical protein
MQAPDDRGCNGESEGTEVTDALVGRVRRINRLGLAGSANLLETMLDETRRARQT